jgi:hypothetical protein
LLEVLLTRNYGEIAKIVMINPLYPPMLGGDY